MLSEVCDGKQEAVCGGVKREAVKLAVQPAYSSVASMMRSFYQIDVQRLALEELASLSAATMSSPRASPVSSMRFVP